MSDSVSILLNLLWNLLILIESNKKSDISKEMPETIAYIRLNLLNVS